MPKKSTGPIVGRFFVSRIRKGPTPIASPFLSEWWGYRLTGAVELILRLLLALNIGGFP
ncbi:hypothetical protein CLV75_2600 [Ruegeria conchae]|uniref:Uncharacterized protein n=1 Tax=Ruegeria conchae TaxID=981384 RepID=A0A497ZLE5_9RHOB|nr:hypothetical protein CLV75_2600 [Ruegeria conchae]